MDRRLLNHYNNELQYLRYMGAEFAREFPKIAGRIALDKDAKEICPDPFVERLLEGVAFLTARVQLKFDAEFPRFTQSLLETVYPHYLSPVPSMAVARFEPDDAGSQLAGGYVIPRGTMMRGAIGRGERTGCEYRTAHDVALWPIRLVDVHYFTRDLAQLELPRHLGARAAIRLRLQSSVGFQKLDLDKLMLYLRGADELPVSIYEQIFARGSAVIVQGITSDRQKPRTLLPISTVRRVGFRDEEALLPYGPRGFQGYRLLREYFAFPQRFLFFELGDLNRGLRLCPGNQVDIIIALDEPEVRLEDHVDAACFDLFCTPVINLFPRRTDRIALSDRFSEFHVVVDKTRPLDFEVFEIESVTAYGARAEEQQTFKPFYLATDTDLESGAFYNVNRVSRVLTEQEKRFGRHTSYTGSEVYLSLVDAASAPFKTELQQLGVTALCTNRHLPLHMATGSGPTDFTMEENAPVAAIRCLTGPTAPRPSYAQGDMAWRIISHLSLNYLSLLDIEKEGAVALREMLKLYADPGDVQMRKQIDGVRSALATPIVRRVQTGGPITFARGLEVTVKFEETAFEGSGVFILGAVLEQFFARYVSLNSFTETVITSEQRGEIIRWPAQLGRRQLI